MAYSEHLADRIRQTFREKRVVFEEKKMMGGLCFMVDEKMCTGVMAENLMARIDPDFYTTALTKKGCRQMDFTGTPLKGFVYVSPDGIDKDTELEDWLQHCLDFNPKAKKSRKK